MVRVHSVRHRSHCWTGAIGIVAAKMLTRVAALCCCLPLIASCDKASAPLGAANAQTLPAAQQPAPVRDTRKVTYEMQEKCAHDARDWYKHWYEDAPKAPGTEMLNDYTNHYNTKFNRCFVLVHSMMSVRNNKTDKSSASQQSLLADVLENREVGSYFMFLDSSRLMQCQLAEQQCTSTSAWDTLAEPYMED